MRCMEKGNYPVEQLYTTEINILVPSHIIKSTFLPNIILILYFLFLMVTPSFYF